MRHFEILDQMTIDSPSGIMTLSMKQESGEQPQISMRREGAYIAISAAYGPLEIALRPRYDDLVQMLARLRPVDGLQTTRQVGTSQAYVAIGYFAFNLVLTPPVRQAFYEWLSVDVEA